MLVISVFKSLNHRTSARGWSISGVLLCLVLSLSSTGASGKMPSASGISTAARTLSQLLARGVRFDRRSVTELLDVLDNTEITTNVRDELVKRGLKALAGDAKTSGEHLSDLEQLHELLANGLNKAADNLENASGPSLDDLANERTRCKTIQRLRKANLSFNESVVFVHTLPLILSAMDQRVKVLENFLFEWTEITAELLNDPKISMIFYNELGDSLVDAEFNKARARELRNAIARIWKKALTVGAGLDKRRENFNSNMETLIEPLSRESCGVGFDQGEVVYSVPAETQRPDVSPKSDISRNHKPNQRLCRMLGTC